MPDQQIVNQIIDRVNDFNRRVRGLEEKIRNLSARINTLDDTVMNKTESNSENIQDLEEDINEIVTKNLLQSKNIPYKKLEDCKSFTCVYTCCLVTNTIRQRTPAS